MALSKAALRAEIRASRPGVSAGLLERLISLVGEAEVIASFSPLPSEPDVSGFNSWVLESGRRLLLPEISGESLSWREPGKSVAGRFGIDSPTGPSEDLGVAQLIIVPALAVDSRGVRLGQGGGFYDRTLANLSSADSGRVKVAAVIFDGEYFDELPAEEHDQKVDAAVSPQHIWSFNRN